jgi:hypothetical protein
MHQIHSQLSVSKTKEKRNWTRTGSMGPDLTETPMAGVSETHLPMASRAHFGRKHTGARPKRTPAETTVNVFMHNRQQRTKLIQKNAPHSFTIAYKE